MENHQTQSKPADAEQPSPEGLSSSDLFGVALDACESVMNAIDGHTCWSPDPEVDNDTWNADAHVEVTLTVKDCRLLKRALSESGRILVKLKR
jgi:hypothetical protein